MLQWELSKKSNEECDPQRRLIEDLIGEIQKGFQQNEYPMVLGVFNEDLQRDNKRYGLK